MRVWPCAFQAKPCRPIQSAAGETYSPKLQRERLPLSSLWKAVSKVEANKALEHLRAAFRCGNVETVEVSRGPLEVMPAAILPASR